MKAVIAVLFIAALQGCGGSGGGGGDDGRKAAIQKQFDEHPRTGALGEFANVFAGQQCNDPTGFGGLASRKYITTTAATYRKIKRTKVSTSRNKYGGYCVSVSWASDVDVKATTGRYGGQYTSARLGHFIVDKVGESQQEPGTVTVPYKAHFEPDSLGTSLMAAGVAHRPADIADGRASLHKDADGGWVAQL